MAVDSLPDLKSVFEKWRGERAHVRVPIPPALIERAVRAARVHGPSAVREATRISARHSLAAKPGLTRRYTKRGTRRKEVAVAVPAFSRVELSTPNASSRPIAELETPLGIKLRIFAATSETLVLVNALCGNGDAS